jgi:hypothetical protein
LLNLALYPLIGTHRQPSSSSLNDILDLCYDDNCDRVFIRKGLLMKVCRSSDKPFTFFLFNNMLMYGTEVRMNLKEKYKISHQLPIDGQFRVERNDQANSKGVAPPKNSWRIVNNVKSFIVYAKDPEEMESWYKDLQKCVAVLKAEAKAGTDNVGVRPIWAPDKDSKACTLCNTDFTVIRRRHHCRKCGTLCCGDCSKARIDIKIVLNPSTPYVTSITLYHYPVSMHSNAWHDMTWYDV